MTGRLPPTPGQTVGPFFHDALPYDGGADLVPADAPGAVVLHGTVRDGAGDPVPDALVEIWQAGSDGAAPRAGGSLTRGGHPHAPFTGFGRAATGGDGRYAFTTLEPGIGDDGGHPFFAVTVFARGLLDRLLTRAYLPDGDGAADAVLAGLDPDRRGTLLAVREDDGSLRFDVRLQAGDDGEPETVFLRHRTGAAAAVERRPAD